MHVDLTEAEAAAVERVRYPSFLLLHYHRIGVRVLIPHLARGTRVREADGSTGLHAL
jgi:hypothetical protein